MSVKALKPKPILHEISVFDIETGSNGQLLDIGFRHIDDYQTFNSWYGFIKHLYEQSETKTPPKILWAHNGGRFDSVALLMELYLNQKMYSDFVVNQKASLINGSILELTIIFDNEETIVFRDSFRLFPMSLEKLLTAFFGTGKLDVPDNFKTKMEDYKNLHRTDYYAYLKQDCDGLYNALVKFRTLVNDISPVGDLPLSLGSLALKIFRTTFLDCEILTPNKKQNEFLTACYAGGRTEYFGMGEKINGIYAGCNYYDVNSMYPAEMLNGIYPIGAGVWTKRLEKYIDGSYVPGAYEIEFEQTGRHIPLLRGQIDGKKTKEHVWKGCGIYTIDEISYLINIGAEIKIKKGLVYPESKNIFSGFIETLYAIRMNARVEKNHALDLVAKLILNNLYGKFGQREEVEQLAFLNESEVMQLTDDIKKGREKKIISITPMDNTDAFDFDKMPYALKSKIIVNHRHVLIAALITARCRCRITGLAEKYWENAIYCDTDSFISQAKIDPALIDPDKLGMLKAEFENVSMQFWGRKQYHIIEHKTLKQKGLKIKNDDMERFLHDIETDGGFSGDYFSPTGIKQSLKSGIENANKFEKYTRIIKPDLSSFEKGLIKI